MQASEFVMTVAVILSPLGWMLLLNLRDRRRSALHDAIIRQFVSEDFRGRIALRIRPGWLWARSVVTIDLVGYSQDEIWEVIGRLARVQALAPTVSLEVKGGAGLQGLATFTVTTSHNVPLSRSSRPAFATG